MKKTMTLMLLSCCSIGAMAQAANQLGCRIPERLGPEYEKIYFTPTTNPLPGSTIPAYAASGTNITARNYPCAQWFPTGALNECMVTSPRQNSYGTPGYFNPLECPLDFYVIPFAVLVTGVCFRRFRKVN